jgi:hypothetical protein
MNTPDHLVCDRVNHDALDNHKGNLRNGTVQQNNANSRAAKGSTSKLNGVVWERRRRKCMTYIKKGGKQHNLGYFENEIEAAQTHDSAAEQLHGEHAALSFPERSRNSSCVQIGLDPSARR